MDRDEGRKKRNKEERKRARYRERERRELFIDMYIVYVHIDVRIYVCGWYLQGLCGNFGFRKKKHRKRSAKWSSQIQNALFPRSLAGNNCKYCKNKDFVGL